MRRRGISIRKIIVYVEERATWSGKVERRVNEVTVAERKDDGRKFRGV